MRTSDLDVNLIATFRAIAGSEREVRRMIVEYGGVVRAEPGNVFFEVYTDADDEANFVIIERYQHQAAFDGHLATEVGAVFNQALTPLIEGAASELQFLTRRL